MATGNVPITAGTGTPIRVITNAGVDSGANQQVFSLADSRGALNPSDPDGTIQVSPEATGLLLDDFSGSIGLNWTTGGTAPTVTAGVASTSTSTTVSATSFMRSNGTFRLAPGSFLRNSWLVQLSATETTNNARWFGYGVNQTTPTSAAPVLNGAVFAIDTDGSLKASTYSNGTRNNVITLTRPSDNAYHRYEIYYRQSVIYWIIDGATVATVNMPGLATSTGMYLIVGSANFTTAPGTGPVLNITSAGMGDQSATNRSISDGVNGWIQATVKAPSSAVAATDLPLAVGFHPTSPLPAGSSKIGLVDIGAVPTTSTIVTTASTNAANLKNSAGNIQSVVVSNPTATAIYVKLYNLAVAPTVGTSVPILTLRVAATGSAGDTVVLTPSVNGIRCNTGISIAATAAAAATDTAVSVAGVQILTTYI